MKQPNAISLQLQVQERLAAINQLATEIPAVFTDEVIGRDVEDPTIGHLEVPNPDGLGNVSITYDDSDRPVGYNMSFMSHGHPRTNRKITNELVIEGDKIVLDNGYAPDGIVLFENGAFGKHIGPQRAARTVGYLSMLESRLDLKLEVQRQTA